MTENTSVKVSVIIPMYNCEDFVKEILETMSAQTLEEIEVICVIDGCSDRAEEIVKEHCDKDSRFFFVCTRKTGERGRRGIRGLIWQRENM